MYGIHHEGTSEGVVGDDGVDGVRPVDVDRVADDDDDVDDRVDRSESSDEDRDVDECELPEDLVRSSSSDGFWSSPLKWTGTPCLSVGAHNVSLPSNGS